MLRVSGRLEKIPAETLPNRNHPRSGRPGRSIDGRPIQAMAADNSFRWSTATSAATLATPATTRPAGRRARGAGAGRRAPDIGHRTPDTGRTGTPNPRRSNALDPGFHGVPTGPAHPECGADGAGVTRVRFPAGRSAGGAMQARP